MRLDLLALYKAGRYPIEIKLKDQIHGQDEAHRQLLAYMERTGTTEGWLVVFDRDPHHSWDEKISWETMQYDGRTIHVAGC